MSRCSIGFVLLMLALAGCSNQGTYTLPTQSLDRAVIYKEQTSKGDWRVLSHPPGSGEKGDLGKADTCPAERVPFLSEIDTNSVIQIELQKDRLVSDDYDLPLPAESEELKKKREALVAALHSVAEFIRVRTVALQLKADLFSLPSGTERGSVQYTRVKNIMGDYQTVSGLMAVSLRALWPGDVAMEKELSELVSTGIKKDSGFVQLNGHLQTKIDEIDREYRALTSRITLQSLRIRMEAFLDSSGAAPLPVHLRGYDKIAQRKVEVEDKLGLAMTPRARQVFEQASKASWEVSQAANQMMKNEGENREFFTALSKIAGEKLGRLAEDLDVLIRELGSRDKLIDRLDALRTALDALKTETLPKLKATSQAAFKAALEAVLASLQKEIDGLKADADFAKVFDLVPKIKAIKAGLSPWRPETILLILEVIEEVTLIVKKRDVLIEKVQTALGTLGETAMKELEKAATGLEDAAVKDWKASPAYTELGKLVGLVERLARVVHTLVTLLDKAQPPVLAHTRSPQGIDVPADKAPNTVLDLKRTPRVQGDTITIRTTLLKDQEVVGTPTEASFVVRQFGWHASFQPGVVLVRPNHLTAGAERFAFAPTVAWLWQYTPLPENGFPSLLIPSVGPHAIFVDFFPDREVEMGLGLSLAFGRDALVLGAGYNLFGEGTRDGRVYYFVGTNLIPLLQQVGVLPAGSAGEKP